MCAWGAIERGVGVDAESVVDGGGNGASGGVVEMVSGVVKGYLAVCLTSVLEPDRDGFCLPVKNRNEFQLILGRK
jgi:hypothetical protein